MERNDSAYGNEDRTQVYKNTSRDHVFLKHAQLRIYLPVNESSLGVHQIEFVIESGESLCDGSGVVQHADCTLDFSQVTARNYGRRLVVDANLDEWRKQVVFGLQLNEVASWLQYAPTNCQRPKYANNDTPKQTRKKKKNE